jgi:hypothetical protein
VAGAAGTTAAAAAAATAGARQGLPAAFRHKDGKHALNMLGVVAFFALQGRISLFHGANDFKFGIAIAADILVNWHFKSLIGKWTWFYSIAFDGAGQ